MAKKKTLESFNNGCTFENYIQKTNYTVQEDFGYRPATLDKMLKVTKSGYEFFKNFQDIHSKRQKPGFFSKLFNTTYNKLYNKESKNLDSMMGDLYKMGVPNELLSQNYKMKGSDEFLIKNSLDDVLYGISHNNMSQKVDRWNNGVGSYKDPDGVEHDFNPAPLESTDKKVREPLDLSNEFPEDDGFVIIDNEKDLAKENVMEMESNEIPAPESNSN